jgi:Peptidase family S41
VFRARSVETASGIFGHLRIFTFSVSDPVGFVDEFVRLIGLLPQDGLILDVRGNGGGHIFASEFTLQTLTPRRIVPEPVQFIATPLNLRICRKHRDDPTGQIDLGPWFGSLDQATETGATFSAAHPITPEDGANAAGQQYQGPVVLITDARCYSATDIFAAGFADHGIGPVLGVDGNTGAGGANVWTHGLLMTLLAVPPADPASPYRALPKGANMRVSIRRTLRVGALAGTPVEDLGVQPDERHRMTRRDVLEGNLDLLDRAGALLAAQPVRRLDADADLGADGMLRLELEVANLDRADVYVDGRPRASVEVGGGHVTVKVEGVAGAVAVRVEGFADGTLVAARTLEL